MSNLYPVQAVGVFNFNAAGIPDMWEKNAVITNL